MQAEAQPHEVRSDMGLLRELDDLLHAMSQPITVLLCTLELGQVLNSVEQIKPLLVAGCGASERLREICLAMRTRLQLSSPNA